MTVRRFLSRIETPIGGFIVVADERAQISVAGFVRGQARIERALERCAADPAITLVEDADPFGLAAAISRYFAGEVNAIDALPVALAGTPFQRAVWAALREIPCGQTWSYARLARHVGRPRAVRAVGAANGANPVGLVVPCHRVIGKDGSLTGYGGGIDRKRWLLAHERAASGAEGYASG